MMPIKQNEKGLFTSKGPDFVFYLDCQDKLCDYQNWTFLICIFGCSDNAMRKLMLLKSKVAIVTQCYLQICILITYIVQGCYLIIYFRSR